MRSHTVLHNQRFQSTFPRGERRTRWVRWNPDACFNPRSREGNDGLMLTDGWVTGSFNPRSREGNDAVCWEGRRAWQKVSIHVPARGTTRMLLILFAIVLVSIHVPARGTTKMILAILSEEAFQSTFPRGERQNNVFKTFKF